jgi:type VI secretion system secreted protein Hcp
MALSMVIKIGSIQGESKVGEKSSSKAAKHVNEIDVLSWNWGLTQSASSHKGSGAGSGTADVRDLTFTKSMDSATPTLIYECFKGNDQATAVLTCLKVGGADPVEFMKITMSGTVFISSVSTGDVGPNDTMTETVSLNFSHVLVEYTSQGGNNIKGATNSKELDISSQH